MSYQKIKALVLATATAATAAFGCGDSDPNAIAPVTASGTITYEGKPVESGNVQFVPEKGRPAGGEIHDGHFTLTTTDLNDGAVPGKHQVAVISTKEVKNGRETDGTIVFLIPPKFSNYKESGITFDLDSKGNSDIKIDLKKPSNDPKVDPSILSRTQ